MEVFDLRRHTMNVEIDGEKIQAEYLEFDNESYFLFGESSFNLLDKIKSLFYRIKNKVRDLYWEIRYGFQRMFNGYDYEDTFETFSKFTERYYKILTEYKRYHSGHPNNLTEEEWESIIDDMIRHLYYMDENNVEKELSRDVPDGWLANWETRDKITEKHKDEFFKLFSEYFYNLWD